MMIMSVPRWTAGIPWKQPAHHRLPRSLIFRQQGVLLSERTFELRKNRQATSGPRVGARARARGADVVLVAVRELRLLLGLLLVLFVTSETWRYVGTLGALRLALVLAVTVGGTLLLTVAGLLRTLPPTMGRRAVRHATLRVLGEVAGFGLVLVVGFLLAGLVTVDAALVAEWTGRDAAAIWSTGIGEPELVLTRPLLQVALCLSALGAVAFAVEAVVDPATRQTLLRDFPAMSADSVR